MSPFHQVSGVGFSIGGQFATVFPITEKPLST